MPIGWETKALRVVAPEGQKLLSRVGNQPMSRNPAHQQTMLTRFGCFLQKLRSQCTKDCRHVSVLGSEYPAANVLKELTMVK